MQLQGPVPFEDVIELRVPPGRYDIGVRGAAAAPVTRLSIRVEESDTGRLAGLAERLVDFPSLHADAGDIAAGEVHHVHVGPNDTTEATVRVGWTGAGPRPEHPFPLSVAPDGRYLVGADGRPFLFHGEAAWSLIAQLTLDEAETYLTDRAGRGVRVLLVNLIEHEYAEDAPRNAYGEEPFSTPGVLSDPNEIYFGHADAVLQLAFEHRIAVLLFPAYVGYSGGEQGWWQEMSALSAADCRRYGDYIGRRYASRDNLIWVSGGDFLIPAGTPGEACALAIRDGLLAADPGALHTTHYSRGTTSLDQRAFADSVDINGIYTGLISHPLVRQSWRQTSLPVFLIEAHYENESGSLPAWRAQSWWAMLSGAMGQLSGNRPIWLFDSGWESALDSPLGRDMERLRTAFDGWAWWRLAPDIDNTWLVAGAGDPDGPLWAAAALTTDGRLGLVYLPPSGRASRPIKVDLARLAGPAIAYWLDPSDGTQSTVGRFEPAGHQVFVSPGPNADGVADWVLVLTVE